MAQQVLNGPRRSYRAQVARWVSVLAMLVAMWPASLATSSVAASAALPPSGPYTGAWTWGPSSADATALDDLGSGWARATVVWSMIEPTANSFAWSGLDQQMAAASGGGKRTVLALVRENPTWAATDKCTLVSDAERQ